MNDAARVTRLVFTAERLARVAGAVGHVDQDVYRRDPKSGTQKLERAGDQLTPIDRMRLRQNGHPRAARYDGDSRAAVVAEPKNCRLCDQVPPCPHDDGLPAPRLVSDPTGTEAMRPDRAAADMRRLDHLVARLEHLSLEAEDIVRRYNSPRKAGPAERNALARQNERPEPGCDSCARIDQARGVAYWSPIHQRNRLSDGTEIAVCQFCARALRDVDRLPNPRELEQHRDGKNVRWHEPNSSRINQ